MDPDSLVSQYAGLAGMAAAVIINILKHLAWSEAERGRRGAHG